MANIPTCPSGGCETLFSEADSASERQTLEQARALRTQRPPERLRADKMKFEAPADFVLARGAQRGGVGVVACRLGAGCRVHASLVLDS